MLCPRPVRACLSAVLLAVVPADVAAQPANGAYRGVVFAAPDTAHRLPGARVRVEGTDLVTVASEAGAFRFDLPPGEHTVLAEAEGFDPGASTAVVEAGGTVWGSVGLWRPGEAPPPPLEPPRDAGSPVDAAERPMGAAEPPAAEAGPLPDSSVHTRADAPVRVAAEAGGFELPQLSLPDLLLPDLPKPGNPPGWDWLAQVGWSALNLALLLWLLVRLGRRPLADFLVDRRAAIVLELTAAKADRAEAEALVARQRERLAELDAERAVLMADYRIQGEAERRRIIEEGRQAGWRIRQEAGRQVARELAQARRDLEAAVADRALELAASEIVGRMDTRVQDALIDGFVRQLARRRSRRSGL